MRGYSPRKSVFAVAMACALALAGIAIASHSYRSYAGYSMAVDHFGKCRFIVNNTPRDIFIPTRTAAEWDSFIAHPPSGVSVSSCIYGCTDDDANNYYWMANVDDGSCDYGYGGCTDDDAENYDSGASWDDGSCEYAPICTTLSHTCSASYSGYEYAKDREVVTDTVYQSCDISPEEYASLGNPSGTLVYRNYFGDCPQCWSDTHQSQGSTWHCSRTMGGYDYEYYRSTFDVSYYVSCTISSAEKSALESQGYVYDYRDRIEDSYPGQWTDIHYMTRCQ